MNEIELRRTLVECLPDRILKRNGQVLYSGIDTLRPGEFYIVGLNPAQDGTNPPLYNVPLNRENWSAYTQQCWKHANCDPECPAIGKAPHQKRVQRIMAELGLAPERTFASNLIFVESRNTEEIEKEIEDDGLFEICWRVHMKMLSAVKPKYIVCLGKQEGLSAFSLMRRKATVEKPETKEGDFKRFVGTFYLDDGLELESKVIGVRHPSRPMNPCGLRDYVLAG